MAATKHSQLIKNDSIEYLTTALLQLLQTTNLNEIKISQLIKRAGVSRMAFYRNFDSLEEVLKKYFEPKISALFDDVIQKTKAEDKLVRLSQFLIQFAEPIKLSIQRNYEYIIKQIFFDNMNRLYESDSHQSKIKDNQKRYWVSFMSAGVYNIWREWILNGQKEPIDEIHDLLAKLQISTFDALTV